MNPTPMKETRMAEFALLGTWHVHAREHVAEIGSLGYPVRRVWDPEPAKAAAFAAAHGLEAVADRSAILEDPAVAGVLVESATTAHPELLREAVLAGKSAFLEKVLATRLADARAILDLVKESGQVVWTSLQRLQEPWVAVFDQVVKSGALGQLTASRVRYQHHGAVPPAWLPDGFFDPDQAGGGAVMDFGAHGFYLSNLFHGAFPEAVSARWTHVTDRPVEDNATVVLTYPGGAMATLETSFLGKPFARWASVHGMEGTVMVDPRDEVVYSSAGGAEPKWVAHPTPEPGESQLSQFVKALRSEVSPQGNYDASLRLTALAEAAYESAALGRPVDVADPVAPAA
jgi:predicted dehydrogenase